VIQRFLNGLRDLALRRGWRGWLILAYVAVQIVAPLHYYTVREDKHDERFAWRMFSTVRMLDCQPLSGAMFTVDGKAVPMGNTFHEAWIKLAERGREVVLEAMADKLCRDHPGGDVRLDLTCFDLTHQPETAYGGFDLCKFPEL
jgi:hypothetical protein